MEQEKSRQLLVKHKATTAKLKSEKEEVSQYLLVKTKGNHWPNRWQPLVKHQSEKEEVSQYLLVKTKGHHWSNTRPSLSNTRPPLPSSSQRKMR
jgi:hypothetical protein